MSPSDYEGLHKRYASLMGEGLTLASDDSIDAELRQKIEKAFGSMMSALYREEGASLRIGILAEPEAQQFIEAHAGALDSSFRQVAMSDLMRQRLQRSNYIFSGMKAFHELNEAFPSLLDENGNRKSFEQFLSDVRAIDKTYNSNYLRAEYNFVQASAEMADKWESFMQDGDRYYLQYRTAGDGRVRPEHAALHGVTLPITDPFWEEFYPPNGWNCRCTVVQVRKSRYPATPHDEAMALGEQALERDTKGMFRFNPGKEGKAVPDYNPYTISRCRDCDIAKGKFNLAKKVFIPDNELCQACKIVHALANADAKQIKKQAKFLQGMSISNPDFHNTVKITKRTLQEWTNQPFKFYKAKNLMLFDIENVFKGAKYLGSADNHKDIPNVVQSHIFETEVQGEKALIIVREYNWGEYILHSISDSKELYKYIKKK